MSKQAVSGLISPVHDSISPLFRFNSESAWLQGEIAEDVCTFTFGNPHDMPLAGFVEALREAVIPQTKDWFAYTTHKPEAQAAIAEQLNKRFGKHFEPHAILMTNGAFAGLNVAIKALVEVGDEVIFMKPHWFAYEGMIIGARAKAIKLPLKMKCFDLDLDAIEAAISPRTRAIIINTPHNPTGKIYSRETLAALADILEQASQRNGRTIYLISDESYNQIIFDDREFISPTTLYKSSILVYTFGKVLLTPSERLGYIALPKQMPDLEEVREAINLTLFFSGWAYPNGSLQYAIKDLLQLSIDINQLQTRRDILVKALIEIGYEPNYPEGTFYLLVKSPLEDAWTFMEHLANYGVHCLPGMTFGLPDYFRICLTASDDMVERSIPRFARAFQDSGLKG